ncbi:MAG: septum formation protein Maf [Clostridia bacterium]|nr:septum formation protein Maf [Clostridia bacterium]MBP5272413.1 septum formation protein Maf [Clostridia bacterium]
MRFILASGSPRRKEILTELGYEFDVKTADFDESTVSLDDPVRGVQALALGKAMAAAEATPVTEPTLFLGSDTVVVLDDVVMGKPKDEEDAAAMLRALSGRTHVVCTGVALVGKDPAGSCAAREVFAEQTEVHFFALSEEDIAAYIATGEPMDKAGAYGIQGLGRVLVEGISGDYETVVGLPAARVYRALKRCGVVPG